MKAQEIFEDAQRFFVNGNYEEAVNTFTQAIEAGVAPSLAYLSRGVSYFRMDKIDEAIQDFSKTIEVNSDNFRGYYYRGIMYLSKDDYKSALPDLNRVIELNPDHGPAHLARGILYGLIGEDEKSAKDMKTAIIQSETAIQGFADVSGIIRSQFNRAMAHVDGEREHDATLNLTTEEVEQVKKWMDAT